MTANGKQFVTTPGSAGHEKLILKGAVIAGGVILGRDLAGSNSSQPAEVFIHDPTLWMSTPRPMLEERQYWEEVAP